MKTQAAALGEKLRSEDGVSQAVAEIEKYWQDNRASGRFHDIFPGHLDEKRMSQNIWFQSAVAVSSIALLAFGIVFFRRRR